MALVMAFKSMVYAFLLMTEQRAGKKKQVEIVLRELWSRKQHEEICECSITRVRRVKDVIREGIPGGP